MKKRNAKHKLKNSKQSLERLSTKKLMIKLKLEKETKWKYQKRVSKKKKNERNKKSSRSTNLKKKRRKRFQGLWLNMKSICKNFNRWRKYRAVSNFRSYRWTSLRSRKGMEVDYLSHSSQRGVIFRPNNWEQSSRCLDRMWSHLYLTIKQWEQKEQEYQFQCLPEAGLERVQRRFHHNKSQAVKWAKSQRKWTNRRNKSLLILKYSIRNSLNPRS